MRRQLLPALIMLVLFTVLTGVIYPLAVTGLGQAVFGDKANGSLVERDGEPVGSRWIGQQFWGEEYFHPRPSATDYSPGPAYASGSNYGPTNETWLEEVDDLIRLYRQENGLGPNDLVPVDAVTGSASSLDPHISIANARLQAERVAGVRGIDVDQVLSLVEENTDGRTLGFLGEPGVNVLLLNLALDEVD
jgi:K+-transporting ATPase ATPase C chain